MKKMYEMTLSSGDLTRAGMASATLAILLFMAGAVVGFRSRPEPGTVSAQAACLCDSGSLGALASDGEAVGAAQPPDAMVAEDSSPTADTTSDGRIPAVSPSPAERAGIEVARLPDLLDRGGRPGWAVQVGAFSVRRNAEALANRLRGRGYAPILVRARNRSGRWLEHVRLRSFTKEPPALAEATRFREDERLPAIVVSVELDDE